MEKLNLPEGWEEGANPFVSGGASARANLTWQKTLYLKGHVQPRMYEVRYAFDPDGYRAFVAERQAKAYSDISGTPKWSWLPFPNCPTFADPVACMVWLEIERAVH